MVGFMFTAPYRLASAAALLSASIATAQISVGPAAGVVTCQVVAGRFQQRVLTGAGEVRRMAGRIRLVTGASGTRWVPAAGFLFKSRNDQNAGVQIALSPDRRDVMLVGLRLPGRPELIELGTLPADRWIEVSVSLDRERLMTVGVAGRTFRRRVRLAEPIESVMHCNSGTFEFVLEPGLGLTDPPAR